MDKWSASGIPFVFLVDYKCQRPLLYRVDDIPSNLLMTFNHWTNSGQNFDTYLVAEPENRLEIKLCLQQISTNNLEANNLAPKSKVSKSLDLVANPISFQQYEEQFNAVKAFILRGESYLLNLSCKTPIDINHSLKELYQLAEAKYKIYLEDQFVCFSPERFIHIEDGWISTFPMKGTIDANLDNAEELLKSDPKEMAEHATIVDLLRNDLSQVARKVSVEDYGYIDRIETSGRPLLQMSSKIRGKLSSESLQVGSILSKLLPAGSISGAPKNNTCQGIERFENYDRGYYTGICGYFDGKTLDTGVMIRFIEKEKDKYFFKSGGGITFQSEAQSEYYEMLNKIYVPISRNNQNRQWQYSSPSIPQPAS